MGRLIIISGPTAGGKDAVRRELVARGYGIVVTTTSRPQRPDDEPGDYEFVTVSEFDRMVDQGLFADVSPVHKGNRYGTRKSQLIKSLNEKMVWRIDPTSAANVRTIIPVELMDSIVSFWVMPENKEELERRLSLRDGHNNELLEKALVQMRADMDFVERNREKFDHVIINRRDRLKEAVNQIVALIET